MIENIYLRIDNNNPLEQMKLTKQQESILNTLENKHLTSFQILKKVDNISLILVVYNIIDELESLGAIKSYKKKNEKYHYTS
ncbi:MAG: Fe2+ or Zn2+ uptake regulation protein [Polaribacter sp.]